MSAPRLSQHAQDRQPSSIRLASILFQERSDGVKALNVAIGNVSLPMHPAMIDRLRAAGQPGQGFADGVVRYSSTVGDAEARQAFLRVIEASGCRVDGLHAQITDGGSQAMELAIVACCGPAGSSEAPLLLIEPAYTNYGSFAARLGRRTVSTRRKLDASGTFELPSMEAMARLIREHRPSVMVVIPFDNPTGQLYSAEQMSQLAQLSVEHDLWFLSDEAYRELHYSNSEAPSIWKLNDSIVNGIEGRRMSIETTSKVWNACGLRIGSLVTDSPELHRACVAEYTANLCANALGQHVFGAIAHEPIEKLREWFGKQREYYGAMLQHFREGMREQLPGAIVSSPDAALYSVVDLRELVDDSFDASDFVCYCAREGAVEIDGGRMTLLTAPMADFYPSAAHGPSASHGPNPGRTQMRIAFVLPPDEMAQVPRLLSELLSAYRKTTTGGRDAAEL